MRAEEKNSPVSEKVNESDEIKKTIFEKLDEGDEKTTVGSMFFIFRNAFSEIGH